LIAPKFHKTSMASWRTLFDKFKRPTEPTPRQVLAAHLRELAERCAPRAAAGSLRLLDERGEQRVAVQVGLSRVEVFCQRPGAFLISLGSGCFLGADEAPGAVKQRRKHLTDLALTRKRDSKDFTVVVEGQMPQVLDRVVQRVEQILQRLLHKPIDAFYAVSIEREPRLDSSVLLDSIRELANRRDLESRRIVYQNVINSHWLLPFKATPDVLALAEVEVWPERLGARPVWAVYSDHEALRDAREPELPYEVVSGIALVRAAVKRGLGAVKINPASKVGGELYANELQSLAGYLDRLRV
jgi:hypothetical protein